MKNCLNQLKEKNLKDISFPAIGTGHLKNATDCAEKMIQSAYEFLLSNKDQSFQIKFSIYEKDVEILEVHLKKTS